MKKIIGQFLLDFLDWFFGINKRDRNKNTNLKK